MRELKGIELVLFERIVINSYDLSHFSWRYGVFEALASLTRSNAGGLQSGEAAICYGDRRCLLLGTQTGRAEPQNL